MKVKIVGVYSPGDIEKERVHLKIVEDKVNIGRYAVMDHTFNAEGELIDIGRHVFRFKSQDIKKADHIILYTKVGKYHTKIREDKTTAHFIYWGRKAPVWNKAGGDTCTLMELHDSQVVKVNTD